MHNVTLWSFRVMFLPPRLSHSFTGTERIFGDFMSPVTVKTSLLKS